MWWYRDGPQKRPILEIDTPQKERNTKKTVPHKNSCSVSPPTKGIIPPQQGEEGEQRNETVRVWKRTQHDPPAAPNQIIQRTTGHNKTSRHVRIKGQKKARKRTNHSSLRQGKRRRAGCSRRVSSLVGPAEVDAVVIVSNHSVPQYLFFDGGASGIVVCKKKCTRYNIRYINWTRTDLRT